MLKTSFDIDFFGISDVGLVREHNEDVWLTDKERGFFIIADGMGGRQAGEIAAQIAVKTLSEYLESSQKVEWQRGFSLANDAVQDRAASDDELFGMGTTLASLVIDGNKASLAHVGDSRIYLYRDKKLNCLTEDHTLVGELVSIGALTPEEAKEFPLKHMLTRAIGTQSEVEVAVDAVKIQENDLLILCSDGLTNYVSEKSISALCQKWKSLKELGTLLVEEAKSQGGGDNVTLILIYVKNKK